MRDAYQSELDEIFADLAAICRQVEHAVGLATHALLDADAAVAEQVIASDIEIDRARETLDDEAFHLISLQQPVAGDLRVIVAALRMVSDLERMGDLAVHVAKIARLRVPEPAVPDHLVPLITSMAKVAAEMSSGARHVIESLDVEAALALSRDDDEMDRLRRQSFSELLASDWDHGVEAAVDVALLGRYFERIADHAVSIANRVVFVVTGNDAESVEVV